MQADLAARAGRQIVCKFSPSSRLLIGPARNATLGPHARDWCAIWRPARAARNNGRRSRGRLVPAPALASTLALLSAKAGAGSCRPAGDARAVSCRAGADRSGASCKLLSEPWRSHPADGPSDGEWPARATPSANSRPNNRSQRHALKVSRLGRSLQVHFEEPMPARLRSHFRPNHRPNSTQSVRMACATRSAG